VAQTVKKKKRKKEKDKIIKTTTKRQERGEKQQNTKHSNNLETFNSIGPFLSGLIKEIIKSIKSIKQFWQNYGFNIQCLDPIRDL